ncbi:MAG TPA: helix-turn-helix domain-containing protein [Candidatus Dormibacteraeota bacterium]|nr:helix-turn-helix domain-containing protein [Candidatus Dormibacteraeota bacterium]
MAKGSFGERLKREREMREVSLDELTKATRISQRFLEALENEDWKKLPGGVFGRGFVRTIAGYLGLDEETLLGEYDLARGDVSRESSGHVQERIPSTPMWVPALAVVLICAALAGLFFAGRYAWHRYAGRRNPQPSSALVTPPLDPSAEPSAPRSAATSPPSGSAATTPAATAPLDLSVSTLVPTHVRILADDKLLLDGELPTGITRHFSARDHFEITAANSSAVLLELNHQAMRPLGPPGTSGTMVLSRKDVRQPDGGIAQP